MGNVAEAARAAGIKRIWYASSACIYPESKQTDENLGGASGLKEDDAWPAQPQDAYGLEKLMTEELLMHYDADFGMEARIGHLYHHPPLFTVTVTAHHSPLTFHPHPHPNPNQARIGRFHNISGPCGTWKGGREKAPAARR